MAIIFQFLAVFTNVWFIGFLIVVEAFWIAYFVDALGNAADRNDIKNWLISKRGTRFYRKKAGSLLKRIDYSLKPKSILDKPRPTGGWWRSMDWRMSPLASSPDTAKSESRRAWSWPLFDFAMKMAVIYPLTAMILTWVVTGGAVKIGELTVIDGEPSCVMRAATIGIILIIFWSIYILNKAAERNKRIFGQIYFGLPGAITGAMGVGVAIILAFAVAGEYPGAFAGVFAATFAFAGAFAGSGAIAFAVVGAFAGAFADSGVFAVAGAVAVAVVGAGALLFALSYSIRKSRGVMGHSAFALILLVFTAVIAVNFESSSNSWASTLIVFLALLPVLNAIFDFFSLGLTRWLVRTGVNAGNRCTLFLGVVDLFSAMVIFAALGFTLIWVLHQINGLRDVPLVDLQALFTGIRANPEAYWWLYISLFTTLVPTFLHLGLSCFCLVAFVPRSARIWVAGWLDQVQFPEPTIARAKWYVVISMSLMATIAFAIPILLIILVLAIPYFNYSLLGWGYLQVFEWFAQWIGATVEIGEGRFWI